MKFRGGSWGDNPPITARFSQKFSVFPLFCRFCHAAVTLVLYTCHIQLRFHRRHGGDGSAITFNFQTAFTLPVNADLSTVSIVGHWASDNDGADILINGMSTGFTNPTEFSAFSDFTLPTGFYKMGSNTLDFVVNNGGGPTALNVYFDTMTYRLAGASAVPEPSSLALFVSGSVTGIGLLRRRKYWARRAA